MSSIRNVYKMKGLSDPAVDIIMDSWRTSTKSQYCVYIKLWYKFSGVKFTPSVQNIIEFLTYLSHRGYNYNQLCMARSAVSALCPPAVIPIGKQTVYERAF